MTRRVLLLSLRPRFANAILAGTKTVELRRRPIKAPPGSTVVLYASAPTRAVVGVAKLHRSLVLDAEMAWEDHERELGLTRTEFDAYLDGRRAHLLVLMDVRRLLEPVQLGRLREGCDFRPPRSFRYVSETDPASVHALLT